MIDMMSIVGTVVGLGVVIFVVIYGQIAEFLLNVEAVVLIFGGTLGSVMISYPWSVLKHVPMALKMMIVPPRRPQPQVLISMFAHLAEKARKEGIDSLAADIAVLPHPFMGDCIQMLIDGLDRKTIEERCERDILTTRHRHQQISGVFKAAGTYAPIFGLLGTLLGVVQVLRNITNPAALGTSMAVAMTASFYGIFSANFLFLPIASKLTFYSEEEVICRELIARGAISLADGEAPWLISKKLEAYLSFHLRKGGAREYTAAA